MKYPRLWLAALALCAANAFADPVPVTDPAPPTPEQRQQKAEQLLASLKPQHGTVKLPNDIATLQLSDDFYYLSPGDADHLITEGWGNPPGFKTLGMILPQKINPLARNGWGVVVTYNDDGHVSDDDAAKIDYTELLQKMQKEDVEINEQRKKQGYAGLHLLGWAEPPHYDAATHKMYWAKELKADDADANTLNYSIRVLGRKGVLELNAVAAMSDLPTIKQELPKVLAFTNFSDGSKYTDFNASTDKVAAYGLAALVAGGIAAKAGLFAKLGLLLFAAKKFVIIGLVAAAGFFRKIFGGKPKAPPPGPTPPPAA
ncbi:MAG: DUF2167 domain-containing protein [Nevskiales bacterium]